MAPGIDFPSAGIIPTVDGDAARDAGAIAIPEIEDAWWPWRAGGGQSCARRA
jgi:hypothetical protein